MAIPESPFPSISNNYSPIRPFVRIIEQPARSLRYRYSCESRTGTISGVSSTPEKKTPFTIEIGGYQGGVAVVVSCVTHENYRPHPHNLTGPNCKDGFCKIKTKITANNPRITFPKLAVQCVKRQDVKEALTFRKSKNVDPFCRGFDHINDIKSIDLNVVRLAVQVLIKEGKINPVVSNPIINKKTLPDPLIYRLSHCNSSVRGRDDDIILLCAKVQKDDIKIRFFEKESGQEKWEDFGKFSQNHVYNNSSICFKPPKYHDQDITEPVRVSIELIRPSDGVTSPAVDFEYLPLDAEPGYLKQKRRKYGTIALPLVGELPQINKDTAMGGPLPQFLNIWSPNFQSEPSSSHSKKASTSSNFGSDYVPNGFSIASNDSTSRHQNFPIILNDIDLQLPSISNLQNLNSNYNIMDLDDFSKVDGFNLENANVVCEVLNWNSGDQFEQLQDIHLSSGDLEMTNVEKLSGTIQDNLVIK